MEVLHFPKTEVQYMGMHSVKENAGIPYGFVDTISRKIGRKKEFFFLVETK